jgi:hypothetical protein
MQLLPAILVPEFTSAIVLDATVLKEKLGYKYTFNNPTLYYSFVIYDNL